MNCERAMQELVSLLTEGRQAPRSKELQTHLESCERCRDEMQGMETLWINLGQLETPSMSDPVAANMLGKLRSAPTPRRRLLPIDGLRRLGLAATIVLSLVAGAMLSRSAPAIALFPLDERLDDQTLVSNDAGGGLFLFLLHRPDGVLPGGRAQRYQQWANELRNLNQLVHAGALHNSQGWMLARPNDTMNATPIGTGGGVVEGFFLITARDSAAVVNAARISPHFDYGGIIEVRRVVD